MRWAYWWSSTKVLPDHVTNEQAVMELNTDFSMTGISANGALSHDTMLHLFRRGEILP